MLKIGALYYQRIYGKVSIYDSTANSQQPTANSQQPIANRRQGFSLVELSIVLVILGLLVGGVLSGQSLIRAAELRSVTRDFQRYQSAVYSFRDKYFYFPGDMPNAVKFWGAAAGGTADGRDSTCAALTTASTSATTCNGNGDGKIGTDYPDCTINYERYRFWQHMANAGMIEGSYAGAEDPASYTNGGYSCRAGIIGWNIPRSRITSAGFDSWYGYSSLGVNEQNMMTFGAQIIFGSAPVEATGPVLKPEEAWNIDTKMDDGLPSGGKIQSAYPFSGCATAVTATATYALTTTTAACSLEYLY